MSKSRMVRSLALTVGTILFLTGCTPLLMVGDSITVGTSSYVEPKLADLGFVSEIDGRVGRPSDEVLTVVRAKRGETGYFVVETGYNDAADPALFSRRFQAIVNELAGATRVVVVTLAESRPYYVTANQTIRAAVAGRANFVVADWAVLVHFVAGALQPDGIHLTAAGSSALAQLIADTMGPSPTAP